MINGDYINAALIDGFEAEDEEAYQLWLRDPSAPVGHVVHLGYHGDSAVYPNYVKYTAKLSNFAVAGHRDVVLSLPSFARQISADLYGEVTRSIGELVLDNADGELDDWLNLALDGQPVRVYHGDPAWGVERFRLLIDCLAETVTKADGDSISIRLRGLEQGSNAPLQTALIPASVSATAPSNLPIPQARGIVFNVRPAIIDEANSTRQWHDGAVTAVYTARDDGSRFQTPAIAISAVNTGTETLSTALAHGFVKDTRVRCPLGTLPSASSWTAVIWAETNFVAVASGTAICAVSLDGFEWTQYAMPSSANWYALANTGAAICAVAYLSDKAAVSFDGGRTWTASTMPSSSEWVSLAWNGTRLVAVSRNGIAASSDDNGLTWTARTMPSASAWQEVTRVGSGFVTFCSGATPVAALSADGITWTAGGALPSVDFWQIIAYSGATLVIIASSSSNACSSVDGGLTWIARTMPASSVWSAVAWNGTVFCAVAQSTTGAATSPDGFTWTARTMPSAVNWNALAFGDGVFCAIPNSTAYTTLSADGITWTAVVSALPAPLVANTDYWVIADGWTTTDFRLAATRGGTVINLTSSGTGALLIGYHWTAELTTGKIFLDSKPSGVLTIDGEAGSTDAGTNLTEVLGAINVDAQSLSRFSVTCPQAIGHYAADRVNRLDVARDLMSGLGAWYGYNRHSLLRAGRLERSYTAHDFAILEDQLLSPIVIESMVPPAKRHRVSYRRNWTNQNGQLVAGVSPEARGLYSTDYSASAPILGDDEGADGSEYHQLALRPDVIESLMVYGGDAQTEALRRDGLYYGWGAILSCTVGLIGSEMDPGDVVKVTYSRYGLDAGVRMALVYVDDKPDDRATILKFFRPLDAYAPGQL